MSNQNSVVEHQIRPNDLMEELGIKKDAYYAYMKQLDLKAEKDENGKAFLTEEMANSVRAIRAHVEAGGKIEEFTVSNSLVMSEAGAVGAMGMDMPASEADPADAFDMEAIYREASEIAGQRLTAGEQVVLAMASQMSYEDLHPETKAKVDTVRSSARPKFNAQVIASDLMSRYRESQQRRTSRLHRCRGLSPGL